MLFLNEPGLFFHIGKWLHLFKSNTNNSIYYLSFVYTQFNFLTISMHQL